MCGTEEAESAIKVLSLLASGLRQTSGEGDREVGSAINAWGLLGSGLKGIKTEPTGVGYSVANFLPLPYPVWETVSQGATLSGGR